MNYELQSYLKSKILPPALYGWSLVKFIMLFHVTHIIYNLKTRNAHYCFIMRNYERNRLQGQFEKMIRIFSFFDNNSTFEQITVLYIHYLLQKPSKTSNHVNIDIV